MANFNNPNNNNMYGYSPYGNYNNTQLKQYAFVNGIEGAKAYPVMPNQTMLLMDSDNPIVYMKTANNMGQSTLRYFKLQEINEQELRQTQEPTYVLKSDFDNFLKRFDDLVNKLTPTPIPEGEVK